ncbi:MAG: GTP-binding protein [Myxococcota bacterium]
MRIPVTVLTGFLGAGKSTLLERWLSELPKDETAVIINEQGEVGIDGLLLSERASRLREISGGCVCCATQAELATVLGELAEEPVPPRRVLVETSGAASPAGVIRVLTWGRAKDRLALDGVITVVDATRTERALEFDLGIEQLAFADVVVLSHADQLSADALLAVEEGLAPYAPAAVFARAAEGQVKSLPSSETVAEAPSALSSLLAERGRALRVPTETPSHTSIEAVACVVDGELDEESFGTFMEQTLAPVEARILRIKGILAMAGVPERVIVQGVGEVVEVTFGARWTSERSSRLVVLGLGLDATQIEASFHACVSPSG